MPSHRSHPKNFRNTSVFLDINRGDRSIVAIMAAPRGRQHRGRSTEFPSDKAIRAGLLLHPGEPVRAAYEDLVTEMGISGAEVIRKALTEMHQRRRQERSSIADLKEARVNSPAA